MEKGSLKRKFKHWHKIGVFLTIYDMFAAAFSYFAALWIRFDGHISLIPREYMQPYREFIPLYVLICIVVFIALRLYNSIWRFASYNELSRVIWASVITGSLHALLMSLFYKRMPLSYYLFGVVIQFIMVLGIRFSYRFILLERSKRDSYIKRANAKRTMVIGAGAAGQMILRELMHSNQTEDRACCIIDDNPNKWGRNVEGIPVVGGRDSILYAVNKYKIEKIYVAIPSAKAEEKREILNICKESGCELKNLPGVYQFVTGEVSVKSMKAVSIEDLLGRETIKVDLMEIFDELKGKTILVTGGGGSIGSELCRQIAQHGPKQLIIFDIYENNAYDIQNELKKRYPKLNLVVLIGSVRDSRRVNQVFETYKPDIVYHAAAHKHVPLMEDSPCESIKNNVIGTYKTAYAAMMNGCKRFVLISTDKAVNPTNIMGASKRICEMIIQTFNRHYETEFVAVRFGNVLGSNGSVIPLFKKQIAMGGPVTVTHPDIIRYFMTIPEAVSLVLQAGAYAKGGEIFVLDMGEPVKILDLAKNLIRLSGYKVGEDIEIEFTGLRPGEKLFEELLMDEEGLQGTANDMIHIGKPIEIDEMTFFRQLKELKEESKNESTDIRYKIKEIVPTYQIKENGTYNG